MRNIIKSASIGVVTSIGALLWAAGFVLVAMNFQDVGSALYVVGFSLVFGLVAYRIR